MTVVGKRIKKLRRDMGITQSKLGECLNLDKTTISHYENDTRMPDMETLMKVADFFKVNINYLLGLDSIAYSDKRSFEISDEEIEFITEIRKSINYGKIMSNPKRYAHLLDINIPREKNIKIKY